MKSTLSLVHSVDSPVSGLTRLKQPPRIGIARAPRAPAALETFTYQQNQRFYGDVRRQSVAFRRITTQGYGPVPSLRHFPQLVELLAVAELHAARGVALWEHEPQHDETGLQIHGACGMFSYRGREWLWKLTEFDAPIVVALEVRGPVDLTRMPLLARKHWRLRRAAA